MSITEQEGREFHYKKLDNKSLYYRDGHFTFITYDECSEEYRIIVDTRGEEQGAFQIIIFKKILDNLEKIYDIFLWQNGNYEVREGGADNLKRAEKIYNDAFYLIFEHLELVEKERDQYNKEETPESIMNDEYSDDDSLWSEHSHEDSWVSAMGDE